MRRPSLPVGLAAGCLAAAALAPASADATFTPWITGATTATPIQHVVVLFDENRSFDHYFGTYPNATNPPGSPAFTAQPGTPTVNGLNTASPLGSGTLLTNNPNRDASNVQANPFLLTRDEALTCDQDHNYNDEQKAYDNGLNDKFPTTVNTSVCPTFPQNNKGTQVPNEVMGYYDGNTVTGLWNLANHFAMSDNSYTSTYGPSTPGAMNLVAGQTAGIATTNVTGGTPNGGSGACTTKPSSTCNSANNFANGSVIGDPDPSLDDCSNPGRTQVEMADSRSTSTDKTIGDLLSSRNQSWGWFEGGFAPTVVTSGTATCGSTHSNIGGNPQSDYSPHHEPFQYFPSTANPHHLSPTSPQQIGQDDPAGTADGSRVNHQYDLSAFWTSVQNNSMPAVSFLKASQYQDGHPGDSDPLDEQTFIADSINRLEQSPTWQSTAVFIAYDDSDGWYDHAFHTPVNPSSDPNNDFLNGANAGMGTGCGMGQPAGGFQDRCGPGTRVPLLAISPWAKSNYVDHTFSDQSSILNFIEYNWNLGTLGGSAFESLSGNNLTSMFDFNPAHQRSAPVMLDDQTGTIVPGQAGPTGPAGPAGPVGVTGPAGANGTNGTTGAQGVQGPAGPQGATGGQGAQGPVGPQGATGPQGVPGLTAHVLCKATVSRSRKIRVTCTETGSASSHHRARISVRLTRGRRVLARGSGSLSGLSLSAHGRLHGLYLLTVAAPGAAQDRQVVNL